MKRRRSKSRKSKKTKELSAAEAIFNSSASQPSWIELPKDVTANILHRLCVEDILDNAQKVCTTWREVCRDPSMWRVIDMTCPDEEEEERCERMCRRAVDLSQRQLIDLRFVADRSSNLQSFTLANCPNISGTALVEAVKKLPQLQELYLTMMQSVGDPDLEAIGISCPRLHSFSYNEHWSEHPDYPNDDPFYSESLWNEFSFVIAKSMPNLHHLQLFSHWMRNEGLEAILDGCPHLESLDIRKCSSLDLQGALGERCKQIKHLRGPSDSTTDFEWPGGEPTDIWDESPSETDTDLSVGSISDYYPMGFGMDFDGPDDSFISSWL